MLNILANVIELVKTINERNELIEKNGCVFDARELSSTQIKALCV